MNKTLVTITTIFISIFLVCFVFTLFTIKKLKAETLITDADIAYHEYTILTDMEDALINSMRVNYHYEWSDDVTMTATVQ